MEARGKVSESGEEENVNLMTQSTMTLIRQSVSEAKEKGFDRKYNRKICGRQDRRFY